jgi:hypothetical protein
VNTNAQVNDVRRVNVDESIDRRTVTTRRAAVQPSVAPFVDFDLSTGRFAVAATSTELINRIAPDARTTMLRDKAVSFRM